MATKIYENGNEKKDQDHRFIYLSSQALQIITSAPLDHSTNNLSSYGGSSFSFAQSNPVGSS